MKRIIDIESSAAGLYDGGWRKGDRNEMIRVYAMDPADADKICKLLAKYEEEASK
jgi:hypothetical protein